MKKKTLRTVIAVMAMAWIATDAFASGYDALPPQLDGTMAVYDFSRVEPMAEWGDSLRPAGVVYVARHGARYWSSPSKAERLDSILRDWDHRGFLDSRGREMIALIGRIKEKAANRWGALSDVGIAEERRLGQEMAEMLPSLWKSGCAGARSTYVPRVVMTMYEFCHSLGKNCQKLDISTSEGHRYDYLLRYFKTDPDYVEYLENGPWVGIVADFGRNTIPDAPARRLLNARGKSMIGRNELRKVSMMQYELLQGLRAAGMEAPTTVWMSADEYEACWRVDNLRHALQRTLTPLSDLPVRSAGVLLGSIVDDIDSFASGDSGLCRGSFYFGHAETVLPLFSAMSLKGCTPRFSGLSADGVTDWTDWSVSPLGANLMLIVLKSDSGSTYVSIRLNGRNTTAGDLDGTVVGWDALRVLWSAV